MYTFCEYFSGVNYFPYQAQFAKRIIRSVIENDGDEITGLMSRQCIPEGTVIHTRDGKLTRIEEYPGAWKTGNKEALEITIKGGYKLRCTSNHPVATKDGWKEAGKLKKGDMVEVLESWDKFGDGKAPYTYTQCINRFREDTFEGILEINEELAELVGWLITDGSVSNGQSIKFTNTNRNYLSRVDYLVTKYFKDIVVKEYTKGNGFDHIYSTDKKDRFNSLKDFMRKMNWDEKGDFPLAVNYFTKKQLCAFFRAVFACDGYLYQRKNGKIEIGLGTGINRVYAEFLKELLNKLGIRGQIKEEWMSKSTHTFYRILAGGNQNAKTFKEVIGEVIDKPMPELVATKFEKKNKYYTEIDGENITLRNVLSIKSIGKQNVWDIRVPEKHWFICSGVKVHNSGKSETIKGVAGGLSIILPTLANTPMFSNDIRLESFKRGVYIGIYAPVLNQSQIIFNGIRGKMLSPHGQSILSDPGILAEFDTNNGQNISLLGSRILCKSASEGSNIEGDSHHIIIVDEAQDVGTFKYSKSISPMASFYNGTKILIGTPTIDVGFFYNSIERNKRNHKEGKNRNHFEYDCDVVSKYNAKYAKYIEGEKVRLGEDSDEFQMSYKLKWMLQRGMFITVEQLMDLMNSELGLSLMDLSHNHVAGIDLGKEKDSTVVTILEVDWEHPVIIEQSKELNVPDYIVYQKTIKSWLELQGDNWEEQYYQIMDYLSNFRIARLVVDATGLGSPVYDRISANVDYETIPYVFSSASKSDLSKHLDSELKSKRVTVPYDADVRDMREYRRFVQQMTDAQKTYSGSNMVVQHPTTREAHDDYLYSLGLACWGAKGEGIDKPVTENNPIKALRKLNHGFYSSRNSVTARRR